MLRRPELAGVPLIVGGRGDPTERAVVSTASPDAVILPVDAPAYEAASARVMDVLRGVDGVVVEVLGWDEAFLGVPTDGGTRSDASALPAHGRELVRGDGERPTIDLWGVGSRVSARAGTARDHDRTAARGRRPRGPRRGVRAADGQLVRRPRSRSRVRCGRRLAVDRPRSQPRAHLPTGPHRPGTGGRRALRRLVTGVFGDLEREGRPAVRITLTVRYVPFFTKTFSRTPPEPTSDHDAVLREVLALAARRRRTDAGPRAMVTGRHGGAGASRSAWRDATVRATKSPCGHARSWTRWA